MKKYILSVLIERDEDGCLVATIPSLKSCYTQAKTKGCCMQEYKIDINRRERSAPA